MKTLFYKGSNWSEWQDSNLRPHVLNTSHMLLCRDELFVFVSLFDNCVSSDFASLRLIQSVSVGAIFA